MFLKSVSTLAKENSVELCKNELVTVFYSRGGAEVIFFQKNILFKKDNSCFSISYDELSQLKISSSLDFVKVEFENKCLEYKTENSNLEKSFFDALIRAFPCGYESSPAFTQENAKDFCNVKFDSEKSSIAFLLDLLEENPKLVKSIFERLEKNSKK
mgnify:CR=1 FL=1